MAKLSFEQAARAVATAPYRRQAVVAYSLAKKVGCKPAELLRAAKNISRQIAEQKKQNSKPSEKKPSEQEIKRFREDAEQFLNQILQWHINTVKKLDADLAFSPGELYQTNQEGTILKLWVPLPWWVEGNKFKVNEYIFIVVPELTKEIKQQKLQEAKELQFSYPELINATNVFYIHLSRKGRIRRRFSSLFYEFFISAKHLFTAGLYLVANGLQKLHRAITERALFLKTTAEKVANVLQGFFNLLFRVSRSAKKLPEENMQEEKEEKKEEPEIIKPSGKVDDSLNNMSFEAGLQLLKSV